jgi:hypothetical protein
MTNKILLTRRKIRGEYRSVKITTFPNGKKKMEIVHKKKSGRKSGLKTLSVKEARAFQRTRSDRSRDLDSRKTGKKITKDIRWKNNPAMWDFPNVDTYGKGKNVDKDDNRDKRKLNWVEREKKLVSKYKKEKDPKKKEKIMKDLKKLEKLTNKKE